MYLYSVLLFMFTCLVFMYVFLVFAFFPLSYYEFCFLAYCILLLLTVLSFSCLCFFFFKQNTVYEMRISDWSSDVCSSDLLSQTPTVCGGEDNPPVTVYDPSGPYTDPNARIDLATGLAPLRARWVEERGDTEPLAQLSSEFGRGREGDVRLDAVRFPNRRLPRVAKRSEAHTSELPSLMRTP